MIFADQTEVTTNSLLPDRVQGIVQVLTELEERTGADLLVSPLSLPVSSDYLLKEHCKAGMLIQRKHGLDLSSSVFDGRIYESLVKMLDWSSNCWLVFVGDLSRSGSGTAVVNSRPFDTTPYKAIGGAVWWYQLRGGKVAFLSDDGAFCDFIEWSQEAVKELQAHPVKQVVHQALSDDKLLNVLANLWAGSTRLGAKRAMGLLEFMDGEGSERNLVNALGYLTDYNRLDKIPGVGEGTRKAVRAWMGLEDWTTTDGQDGFTSLDIGFWVKHKES